MAARAAKTVAEGLEENPAVKKHMQNLAAMRKDLWISILQAKTAAEKKAKKAKAAEPVVVAAPAADAAPAVEVAADAETLLKSPLQTTFKCDGQAYGYYADVQNNCQVFHICLPIENDAGEVIETAHWSFICGNGTIFDQATLTCNHEADAFPCEDAPTLYGAVEFGKIDS